VLIRRLSRILSAALALTSVSLFADSAYGQAQGSKPGGLESEVADVKAENAAMREQLRKIEEQQKILLEQVDRLQRRLDRGVATDLSIVGQPTELPTAADVAMPTPDPMYFRSTWCASTLPATSPSASPAPASASRASPGSGSANAHATSLFPLISP